MANYKYTTASLAASAKRGTSPKEDYVDLFQQTLNEQFYNSSNWWTIEEETAIGSQEYEDVDVRISHVINAETGLKLGDDWKTLFFINVSHPAEMGKYYVFDDNTWITTNIEFEKNLTGTCTIRRCNNTLRWIDEATGGYYEEPCAIEYLVKEPRDYATQGSPFMTPGGFLHIQTQLNERTILIAENQRFLFGGAGHWMGYKVIGAGINNFRNTETYDNESAKVLTLDLIASFINPELDDIVDGIADVYTNVYQISVSSGSAQGNIDDTIQLDATVYYNDNTVTRELTWESSNVNVASVDDDGLVTCNALGQCEINVYVKNSSTFTTSWITVTATPENNYEIVITPDTNYVLEGQEREYTVYLYENNIQQADTFVIECDANTVPSANYTFTGGSVVNRFKVVNDLRDLTSYLTIQCTSGSYTPKEFDIYLRGAWLHENV